MKIRSLSLAVALGCAIAGLSASAAHAVPPTSTSTTLTVSPNAPTLGEAVTFAVTVSPVPPGGTVSLYDNSQPIAGCQDLTLTAGKTSCVATASGDAGYHAYSAMYFGSAGFADSADYKFLTVRDKSTTTVTAKPKLAAPGEQMTYVAKVTPRPEEHGIGSVKACYAASGCGEPVPEYVKFSVDGTVIDACKQAPVNTETGIATCTASAPTAPGPHTVTASYLGHEFLSTSEGSDTFAVKGPGAAVSIGMLEFDPTVVGTASTGTVELVSTGTGALQGGAATVNGAFAVTGNACSGTTLAPGATCTVTVAFKPTATGAASGSLTIDTSAGARVVTLSGTGVKGAVFAPNASTTLTTTSPSPKSSSVSVPLACPSGVACTLDGTIVITTADFSRAARASAAKTQTVARFSGVRVAAGKIKKIKLKLSPKFIRDAQKRGVRVIRATLTVNTTFTNGTRVTTQQRVKIRIPRPLQARRPAQAPRFTG